MDWELKRTKKAIENREIVDVNITATTVEIEVAGGVVFRVTGYCGDVSTELLRKEVTYKPYKEGEE